MILAPFFAALDAEGVPYTSEITEHASFLEGYNALFDGEAAGVSMFMSSRLILREHVEKNVTAVTEAFRAAAEGGRLIIAHIIAPGRFGGVGAETAVNPVWKRGLLLPLYIMPLTGEEEPWEVIRETLRVDEGFKRVSPGSGAYLNEANIYEPEWRNDFYGKSYARLLEVKKKVDPLGVFYAKTAVGSEFWEEVNGRLCRT